MQIDFIQQFFDIKTLPFYFIGIVTFIISIIDDLSDSKRKSFWLYLQDFLYSLLSISIGISACIVLELSHAAWWIVVIVCGLVGASLLRYIDKDKDMLSKRAVNQLSDAVINKLSDKVNLNETEDNKNNDLFLIKEAEVEENGSKETEEPKSL